MKIMVFFNSMSPAGGIERVIASHIKFMTMNHEVILVTKDDGSSFYSLPQNLRRESLNVNFTMNMGSSLHRVAKVAFAMFGTITALRRKIKRHEPDAVYVATPLNLLEIWLAGVKPRSIIVTEHSSHSAYNAVYQKIISLLYPLVGLLTVPTKSDSEYYAAHGIRNAYLPNPLPFYPNGVASLSGRQALCVGRLTDDKRHDLLLNIWSASALSELGWKLQIVGKGENEERLRDKIRALGMGGNVFISAPTTHIQDVYVASSIFLLTSRAEGFGLVLAEAMACGVPCISFDCPSGPRDIIEEGLTGRLLKEGDIPGYVEALRKLAMDPRHRQDLANRGRLYVRKFHADTVGDEFRRLLNEAFLQFNPGHKAFDPW